MRGDRTCPTVDADFVALLDRVCAGCEHAATTIYCEYEKCMRRGIVVPCDIQSKVDEDDLSQLVWAAVFARLRDGKLHFQSPGQLTAYLRQAFRNAINMALRFLQAEKRNAQREVGNILDVPLPRRPASEQEYLEAQLLLNDLLDRLPPAALQALLAACATLPDDELRGRVLHALPALVENHLRPSLQYLYLRLALTQASTFDEAPQSCLSACLCESL